MSAANNTSSATAPSEDATSHLHWRGAKSYDSSQKPLLSVTGLTKSYHKAQVAIPVLRGVDLSVHQGEVVSIVGQSGSGKSTLLHLLGTLDRPDAGEIYFAEQRIDNLPARMCDTLRNRSIGMIFQFYHLLPELTLLENVLSPLMIQESAWNYWKSRHVHKDRASELLEMMGLSHRIDHRPNELSGGELQRAAIARSLIAKPQVLLADEPTGNLDQQTGSEILRVLRTLNDRENLTIVMVTHDYAIAQQADRLVQLVEGRVTEVESCAA